MFDKIKAKIKAFLWYLIAYINLYAETFKANTRGDAILDKVIGIGIGLFVAGILVAQGITQIISANTTGWDTGVKTVFVVLLPVLGVVGLVYAFIKKR